eukprot:Trichotokara_eunicae@DN6814_c0_g1_i1.p1
MVFLSNYSHYVWKPSVLKKKFSLRKKRMVSGAHDGLRKLGRGPVHKERKLPALRFGNLGLLEKHKDYKERALFRQEEEAKIKRLNQAATLRNPDEYSDKMITHERRGKWLCPVTKPVSLKEEISSLTKAEVRLRFKETIQERKLANAKENLKYPTSNSGHKILEKNGKWRTIPPQKKIDEDDLRYHEDYGHELEALRRTKTFSSRLNQLKHKKLDGSFIEGSESTPRIKRQK